MLGFPTRVVAGMKATPSGLTVSLSESREIWSARYGRSARRASLNIWVDAIYINQVDLVEKGCEVGMMYTIFSQATAVCAHLGDALDAGDADYDANFDRLGLCPQVVLHNDDTDAAIARQQFPFSPEKERPPLSPEDQHRLVVATFCYLWCRPGESHREIRDLSSHGNRATGVTKIRDTESKILACPWWDRVWIVQEAGVATVLTLTYGRVTAPFSLFVSAACSGLVGSTRSEWRKVFQLFELRWFSEKPNILAIRSPKPLAELSGQEFEENIGTPTHVLWTSLGDRMMWLLRVFRERKATEVRDKIFSLRQLASHESRMAHCDYEQDLKILFEGTTRRLIKSTAIFWLTTSDLEPHRLQALPSWVPDWSCCPHGPNESVMWRWLISPLYNVGRVRFAGESGNQTNTWNHRTPCSAVVIGGRRTIFQQYPSAAWLGCRILQPPVLVLYYRLVRARISTVFTVSLLPRTLDLYAEVVATVPYAKLAIKGRKLARLTPKKTLLISLNGPGIIRAEEFIKVRTKGEVIVGIDIGYGINTSQRGGRRKRRP